MNEKVNRIKNIVLPDKKINYFVFSIIVIGIITGSIFFTMISNDDKTEVINLINNFLNSIKSNSFDSGLAFKNSLISNLILIVLIWIFGMSVIGLIFNIFIVYIKGFILGFSISSFIATFKLKGLVYSFAYIFPSQIINIITITVIGIYSVVFSIYLIKLVIHKKISSKNMLKKYFVIFIFAIFASIISSLWDSYVLPNILSIILRFL